MFAVVKTGGKQYRVAPGDVVLVERLQGEEGQAIKLDNVLMISDGGKVTVGAPMVAGAAVEAVIKAQTRGEKIIVFKKKRRQGYRRKNGHRQDLTLLTITSVGGTSEVKAKAPKSKAAPVSDVPATVVESVDETKATKPKATRAKKKDSVEE
jgi:large subunit ribosomal protein L21